MHVEYVDLIDSTNSELLRRAAAGLVSDQQVLIAAAQSAGRGRAGRTWASPGCAEQAENLYLSMLLTLAVPLAELAPLTLALAVAARRVIPELAIKWPNDLFLANKKVGGILVEIASSDANAVRLVAGIGINIRMPAGAVLDQPVTDLASHGLARPAQALGVAIATQWQLAAQQFAVSRLHSFGAEYRTADLLFGTALMLSDDPETSWQGAGINSVGALLVSYQDRVRELTSGEVRVRVVA
jgi:BirA family transcriptional regulator, biotin operon repressor / biotin---[acetyl-CoA-carboxylase] ligase